MVDQFGFENGFSLLEVMVALFMVALISSSLMGGFVISNRMLYRAERVTQASNHAYQILENIRACPPAEWTSAVEKNGGDDVPPFYPQVECCAGLHTAVNLAESDIPGLFNAEVVVTWEDGGDTQAIVMTTLLNPALCGDTP